MIARAGLASRREAEAWIAAGRVAVNGAVIASPALNVGAARPHRGRRQAAAAARTHAAVPLSQAARAGDHACRSGRARRPSSRALPKDLPRLISVGRLDINTEGLLLLTNDGGLARVLGIADDRLAAPLPRARARPRHAASARRLRDGITIDGVHYGPIEATLDREQGTNVWLTFAIREGKNREVRNVLEHLGLKVNRLIRVSFGPFQLGELADGAIEEVKTEVLRDQLGPGSPRRPRSISTRRSSSTMRASAASPRRVPARATRAQPRGTTRQHTLKNRPSSSEARQSSAPQDDGSKAARAIPRKHVIDRDREWRTATGSMRRGKIMRVVGGRLRSRPLAAPKSHAIRPTADRLREALFNILAHGYGDPVTGARVLDLFAGTGALGIEAMSRGAAFRAVCRRRRGSTRAAARQCRNARPWRRHPHLPPRCDQARPGASARSVFARLPRSALWQRPGREGARRRRATAAG